MDDKCTNERPNKKRRLDDEFQRTNAAEKFLFRSPASSREIEEIANKMRNQIETTSKEIKDIGFEAYSRKKNGRGIKDGNGGDGDEKGMDTDDEIEWNQQAREKVAVLEEAVIRGDPRRYQIALVELAKHQNTIINLGTGQGKTLIALLLIRHFAKGAYENGKQTLFLVPSVALATQHTTTLEANLPYTVSTACHNSTKTIGSRERMAEANILVATHGAARDLLMHYGDMFSFDRINLLILDECHYTSGEHGYATIMRNFYHRCPTQNRPRVLGLTASPLVNIKSDVDDEKLSQMLRELEHRLDAKIACLSRIGVADAQGNLSQDMGYVSRHAEEKCIHYHRASHLRPLPPFDDIGLHEGRVKELNQLLDLYNDLGPKLTYIYSKTVAREISRNRYEGETHEQFALMVRHLLCISEFCEDQCRQCPNGGKTEKLAVLEQLLEDIIESKGAPNTVGVVFVDRRITALALYDYFRTRSKAVEVGDWVRVVDTEYNRRQKEEPEQELCLATERNKDGQIFDIYNRQFQDMHYDIDQLNDAIINDVLQDALPKGMDMKTLMDIEPSPLEPQKDLKSNLDKEDLQHRTIRCDMIVRQCTSVFKYLDKSHHYSNRSGEKWLHKLKKVKDVLDGLRTKQINVLIATSVVEEGVDVDACSFVIVFDHIRSTKAYVQMKGRARQQNARFFVFQDTSPEAESSPYLHLQTAQIADLRVRQFIESRPEYSLPLVDPNLQFGPFCGSSVHAEQEALLRGEYRTCSGFVDLSSAKTLLNRYTLSIPLETTSRSTRDLLGIHLPQFEENRLMLPAHIPSSARCVLLPPQYLRCTKKEKRNVLALMACVRLHRLHLLNDRMLPLKKKDMQNKLLGVALTELFTSGKQLPQKCPPMPGQANDVFVYKLDQMGELFEQNDKALGGDGRSLCLVTLVPLKINQMTMSFHHLEIGMIDMCIRPPETLSLTGDEWDLAIKFHTVLMNARWRKRTGNTFFIYSPDKVKEGILPPYVCGCLDKDDEIDWERMRQTIKDYGRNDEERINAVRNIDREKNLTKPRIWSPIYDPYVSYIAYGPSGMDCEAPFPEQVDGVKTYSDYFTNIRKYKVDKSSELFAVQRQWYLPRKMQKHVNPSMFEVWKRKLKTDLDLPDVSLKKGERNPCEGLVAALLPMDACLEAPIADAALFLHCLILPQILYHMDQLMTAQLFVEHCLEHLPVLGSHVQSVSENSFDDILEALTAKSCVMSRNYDRLEWVGDAVLKLIHTDALLNSRDLRKWVSHLHEGDLSLLRSAMGSNNRLMNASKGAGFDRFILFRQLGRGQWVPIGMELHEIKDDGTERLAQAEQVQPGRKTTADIIESILGLIFKKISFQAAYDVATELGITLPRDPDYDAAIPNYKPKQDLLPLAANFLGGVKFKHLELLEESITHPSCIHECVPCYQRLEWVGDAVLCLFARNWIYDQYPDLLVGELVILEATMVCNETLAYLSVANGLQRHLNHRDPSLPGKISDFQTDCNARGLWATDPPKTLSDIVEAMFGAVFVDSGLDTALNSLNHAMKPITDGLISALSRIESNDLKSKARAMVHPKQYVHELGGGILNVKAWREEVFAIKKRACPVWKDGIWGEGERDGSNFIAVIESYGIDLLGIEEKSSHVARNRACAITMEVFEKNPDLIDALKSLSQLFQTRVTEMDEDEA